VRKNRRLTIHEMANEAGISYDSCQDTWTKDFEMRHVSAKSVLQLLTQKQKENQHFYLNTVLDILPTHHIRLPVYFCSPKLKKFCKRKYWMMWTQQCIWTAVSNSKWVWEVLLKMAKTAKQLFMC
jgi:hypothetical protein